jgi:hypothetical protein
MHALVIVTAALACAATPACGQMVGDCSGGYYADGTCLNTQKAVHWTDASATAAARAFDDAQMVKGHLTNVHCAIIARLPAHEATSLCRGLFVAPGTPLRRVAARFSLSGIGAMNPDCSHRWKTSPYCSAKNREVTTGDG